MRPIRRPQQRMRRIEQGRVERADAARRRATASEQPYAIDCCTAIGPVHAGDRIRPFIGVDCEGGNLGDRLRDRLQRLTEFPTEEIIRSSRCVVQRRTVRRPSTTN